MRAKIALLAALCLALVLPASTLGGDGGAKTVRYADTAIAYYFDSLTSPEYCVVLSMEVDQNGPGLTVQFNPVVGPGCTPSGNQAPATITSWQIHRLTAAYVVASATVGSHAVVVDVAWVATGPPLPHREDRTGGAFIGRDAPAHLTGSVTVDSVLWRTDPTSGTLRSGVYQIDN